MDNKKKLLIIIAGPTASGKTATALKVAGVFNTIIVSADSRQVYREMSVGTAKPDKTQLLAVEHHFVNTHSIQDSFTAGDYERECTKLLTSLFQKHDKVVLTGGSGLFIKAVTEGFDDIPSVNKAIRNRLNAELAQKGLHYLQEKLRAADPLYFHEVDRNNPQRVIRALEVFESTGKKVSGLRKAIVRLKPFEVIRFGLNMDRKLLYERINNRVDSMIADGLLEEVQSLIPYRSLIALNTVGYSELFNYFDGETNLNTAISAIKQNTRRYAKRQTTWFKKDKDMIWMDALSPTLIQDIVKKSTDFIG